MFIYPSIPTAITIVVSIATVYIAVSRATEYCVDRYFKAGSVIDRAAPFVSATHLIICCLFSFRTSFGLAYAVLMILISIITIIFVPNLKRENQNN